MSNPLDKPKLPEEQRFPFATSPLERGAERFARSIGSPMSLLVHTFLFVGIFTLSFFGFSFDQILLLLTTLVSLEAIYLAIFIQMTVNRQAKDITEVHEHIEDIREDVEDISEDIEGIQENVEEIGEDVEGIQKEVEEIGDDVEDIQKDVDGIQEDVEDIGEEERKENDEKAETDRKLEKIETLVQSLTEEIKSLRKQ